MCTRAALSELQSCSASVLELLYLWVDREGLGLLHPDWEICDIKQNPRKLVIPCERVLIIELDLYNVLGKQQKSFKSTSFRLLLGKHLLLFLLTDTIWVVVPCFLFYFEVPVSSVLCFPALPVPVIVCPVPDCDSLTELVLSTVGWTTAVSQTLVCVTSC